jgi:hypothetical protein
VDRRSRPQLYAVHTGWVVLLLLVHFNLFWNMIDIFSLETWRFHDFLYVIAGPIVLFFATHVILAHGDDGEMREHYYSVSRQFFLFLALLQLWSAGVGFVLLQGLTPAGVFNLVFLVFALILASTRRPEIHRAGVFASWLLFLTAQVLQGLEVAGF